jgi:release factor glutamine methyltransferase
MIESAIVTRLRGAGCVFAEEEAKLLLDAATGPEQVEELVARRAGGEPLEYVLGWADFGGLRIAVEPGVFVPRHRTEFLVEQALLLAGPTPVVLDLCCGSGAVGVALVTALDRVELHATDLDPVAVHCARVNVGGRGQVYQGDLFGPLPAGLRGRVDLLAANVPYVPTDAVELLPPEARLHEHRLALDGGADGLAVLRRVAAEAPGWLSLGGHLLTETSERQAPVAIDILVHSGLSAWSAESDDLGSTVVIGRRDLL